MPSDACDVLIVGGGPAGSSCAWGLREAGLDVLVVDRKAFPRDKVCAGWVTPQVISALEVDLEEYARSRVCQGITGFRTGLIGGREVENHYDRTVSYGIRRCEFDEYLLARCGARTCEAESVDRIERDDDGWIVNGTLRARLLVGAGGHFCPVARLLGARSVPGTLVVAAQEIEFAATPVQLAAGTIEAAVPELFFCRDLEGYGWCFRKGDYLNIGLGRTKREQLATHVQQFVDFLRSRGKIDGDVPGRFHGHAYQLYERTLPVLCDDAVLLVGDAAGLAYPQSGEGIRPAVESGLLAAGVIAAAEGNYARGKLAEYERQVIERLGRPRAGAATDWLPASWLRGLAQGLMASRRFAKNVVIERWFLHMHEPALVPPVGNAAHECAG
ncbi:MAG: NAD(P)/FAD-dependent oxidoreductase [Planctomycetota bacterium]|nr:MAG: NAD(P)/FAD-dependent oxidoreductase [Planctomycetota bacterium]